MGRRPKNKPFYDTRDTRGQFASSEVHPVAPEPCPTAGCGYPDSGEHDCPAGQTFDDWVGDFAATPVGPMAMQVAANFGLPPFLRFKQSIENAALSGAAYRNHGEVAMLGDAITSLELAIRALRDLAEERGDSL